MFDDIQLNDLRARTSEKWSTYPQDVLPAFVAEMDFPLAPPVLSALKIALDRGDCGYANPTELGAECAKFLEDRFGWTVDATHIFALPDVMAGVAQTIYAVTKAGDCVAINPPVYPPFFETIRATGRQIVEVPLSYDRDGGTWTMDFPALERSFAQGVRAFLLCSPHNPVGRVWTAAELQSVASLARKHDVTVISDEIHAPLVMPGNTHHTFGSVDQAPDFVSLFSASKAWNIAGLKCGLLVAGSQALCDTFERRFREIPTETNWRVGQLGVIASLAAFRHGLPWLDRLRDYLDGNRRLLGQLLQEHFPDARYTPPEASYLAWIDCQDVGLGPDPAQHFLEHGRVALEPGRKFGQASSNFVRLNMGTSSGILREIVLRMALSCAKAARS